MRFFLFNYSLIRNVHNNYSYINHQMYYAKIKNHAKILIYQHFNVMLIFYYDTIETGEGV